MRGIVSFYVLGNSTLIIYQISIPSCHHLCPIGSSKNAQCSPTTPALFQRSDRTKLTTIWAPIWYIINFEFPNINLPTKICDRDGVTREFSLLNIRLHWHCDHQRPNQEPVSPPAQQFTPTHAGILSVQIVLNAVS